MTDVRGNERRDRLRGLRRAAHAIGLLGMVAGAQAQGPEPEVVRQVSGELPDGGGPYRMQAPPNWNGVLILDLDFADQKTGLASESPLHKKLYELGYAGAGSSRLWGATAHGGTPVNNPARIARQLEVLRRFEAKFGKPKRVISFGLSGAGGLALALLEEAPERIDGSVAACITTGAIGWFNSKLDAAFAARTLIASAGGLPLQNMPLDLTETSKAWTDALTVAQSSPEGQARIALAVALGQLPTWTKIGTAEPDPSDLDSVQRAMFDTLVAQFAARGGGQIHIRRDFEGSSGGPLSWNEGIDYRRMFATIVDPAQRKAVRDLYRRSGLDLAADLRRLDTAARETADPRAVDKANRLLGVTARPTRPVLLYHTSGDALAPASTLEAYARRAPRRLVRSAIVRAAGHCTFGLGETIAAIETVDRRIVSGRWPETSAAAMNLRASARDSSPARFIDHKLGRFGRAFYLDDVPPRKR